MNKDKVIESYNKAVVAQNSGKIKVAKKLFEKTAKEDPLLIKAQLVVLAKINLGVIMIDEGKLTDAVKLYEDLIEKNFSHPGIFNNLAVAHTRLGNTSKAEAFLRYVVQMNPNFKEAHYTLASSYAKRKEFLKAKTHAELAVKHDGSYQKAYHLLYHVLINLCEWGEATKLEPILNNIIDRSKKSNTKIEESPFLNLIRVPEPKVNYEVSKSYCSTLPSPYKKFKRNKTKSKKIRIAYASNGFKDFPTAHNLVEVLKLHDRNKFEVYAYSWGQNDDSNWRDQINNSVDKFIDISKLSFLDSAKKINKDKIDMLIDLKGHTEGNRIEMFAHKPSPIQISYLGYPATTGANFMDYFIADKTVVPFVEKKLYSEKVIYLPDSYRATNNKTKFKIGKRSDYGFPENKFTFCSFNASYKITKKMFNAWIKILKNSPNSVLVHIEENEDVQNNLVNYLEKKGIKRNRIIFVKRLKKEDHLSRISVCDLALDTSPVNGHTTTVDCLWASVPVITLKGTHFASRVSESVLSAINLNNLTAKNYDEYSKLAINYSKNKSEFKKLKSNLNKNVKSTPLFDTKNYTKNLEKAYLKIWNAK